MAMVTPTSEKPVLFAYDGSEHAKAAIAAAAAELRTGRPAVVLTVWEPLEALAFYGAPMAAMAPDVDDSIIAEAEKAAAEGAALAREGGFEAEARIVRGAPTWRQIVDGADDVDAGVIVLGTHGRSGVTALVMGSVATAVAHHATRPVLIVPLPPR